MVVYRWTADGMKSLWNDVASCKSVYVAICVSCQRVACPILPIFHQGFGGRAVCLARHHSNPNSILRVILLGSLCITPCGLWSAGLGRSAAIASPELCRGSLEMQAGMKCQAHSAVTVTHLIR